MYSSGLSGLSLGIDDSCGEGIIWIVRWRQEVDFCTYNYKVELLPASSLSLEIG